MIWRSDGAEPVRCLRLCWILVLFVFRLGVLGRFRRRFRRTGRGHYQGVAIAFLVVHVIRTSLAFYFTTLVFILAYAGNFGLGP